MSNVIFLKGNKIDLCPLDGEGDLTHYESWVNDQENTKYMAVGNYPSTKAQLKEYIQHYGDSKSILLGIFLKKGGRHIGNITLHQIDHHNRTAEIGILIGDKASQGKGFGTQALKLIAQHAFRRLNLHKLTTGMVVGNTASQKMFEKVGFKQEGCLREHFYLDGKYHDCLRYGLLRSECFAERKCLKPFSKKLLSLNL